MTGDTEGMDGPDKAIYADLLYINCGWWMLLFKLVFI